MPATDASYYERLADCCDRAHWTLKLRLAGPNKISTEDARRRLGHLVALRVEMPNGRWYSRRLRFPHDDDLNVAALELMRAMKANGVQLPA